MLRPIHLYIATNDVWAVGDGYSGVANQGSQTLTMHWDGSKWTIMPSPDLGGPTANNGLSSVSAADAHNVWAVGSYSTGSGQLPIILFWVGNQWTLVGHPNPNPYDAVLFAVAARAWNDVWAVGDFSTGSISGVYYGTLVLHWDGRQWVVMPSIDRVIQTSILYGIAFTSSLQAWAVGWDYNQTGFSETLVESFV